MQKIIKPKHTHIFWLYCKCVFTIMAPNEQEGKGSKQDALKQKLYW